MSFVRRMSAVALVLSALLLGGAVPVRADRHDDCRRDIHRAEWNLRRAIDRHGEGSRQAEFRRHQLHEIRERCRDYDHERREERREHEEHEEHEMHEHER
jgi:hypothetical protein